jgi:hypothetical protein
LSIKKVETRIQHKRGTEDYWKGHTGFIPLQGELIVYDIDASYSYERFKIGDGTSTIEDLPFTHEQFGKCTIKYDSANECLNFTFG